MGTQWQQCQTLFWGGSEITAGGDCSHEIKRRLLLGRKATTNLGSILKSRDISLPTKACIIKAMVFPAVMYNCKSWSIKKAECWRIDAFELWCWRKLLSPLDSREIKPVNPKGNQSWILIYSLEGLKLKLPYFGHLIWKADSLEQTLVLGKIEGRRRGRHKVRCWMESLTQWTWAWANSRRQWRTVLQSSGGCKEMGTTQWTTTTEGDVYKKVSDNCR